MDSEWRLLGWDMGSMCIPSGPHPSRARIPHASNLVQHGFHMDLMSDPSRTHTVLFATHMEPKLFWIGSEMHSTRIHMEPLWILEGV